MGTQMATKVIFRKFGDGDVIALFPELSGTGDVDTCASYMHVGQHSAASVRLVADTRPATEEDYAPLKQELERLGYQDLQVVKRFSPQHRIKRWRDIYGLQG